MSPIKEPGYFGMADCVGTTWYEQRTRERERLRAFLAGPQTEHPSLAVVDLEDYVQLFRDAGNRTAIGEASVAYFLQPSAPVAIRAAVPEARFIFLLRDPAERLSSQYLRRPAEDGPMGFRQWLEARSPEDEWWTSLDAGRYATNLRRFYDNFSPDRIQVHLYEDFTRDPASTLRTLFSFLGVDSQFTVDVSVRHNRSLPPRSSWLHGMRRRLLGDASLTRWLPPRAAHLARGAYRGSRASFRLSPEDRRLVIDRYRSEIDATAGLLGRDLSAWLR